MSAIFNDIFDKETFAEIMSNNKVTNRIYTFFKSNRVFVKICSLCMIGLMMIAFSLISGGVTYGFKVKYAGEVIATVKDADVFNDAKELAINTIKSNNAERVIETPEFSFTITVADRFDNALKLADTLIEKNSNIIKASALKVNGKIVACTCDSDVENYLESSRTRFDVEGAKNNSEFLDEVRVVTGYYLKSDIVNTDDIKKCINSLPVKTVSTVTADVQIPYSSETVKSDEKLIGYSEITTLGEIGVQRTVSRIEYLNGVESSRNDIQTVTVKEPVTEITTVGTAKSTATAADRSFAGSAGFICPLNKGTYKVSAYYGDGRAHKGVDLAADKGTSIFAAAGGTVTYAGFSGDYGYSVIIDHGNGIKTRYAHASLLCVNKGDKVAQGELIALVGMTGYATGNHLHFEVIVNGAFVDPSPFIGIG